LPGDPEAVTDSFSGREVARTLINNAGTFIGKPFTEYTPDDYATATA
jgi:hypothetical protein